ncbi:hypothetical protein PG991_000455 [Apiospora marii]|uniref:Helicase C-terminal domain-containing protein n=1 Tax=Apiospora marii TaxID=335849 RepID=A0ABR1T253_9PEZI
MADLAEPLNISSQYFNQNVTEPFLPEDNEFLFTFDSIQSWADSSNGLKLDHVTDLGPQDALAILLATPVLSSTNVTICFGMLNDISVKLIGNMAEAREKVVQVDGKGEGLMYSVGPSDNYVMLNFPDGSPFAQVNEGTSKALSSVFGITGVYVLAFTTGQAVEHVLRRAKTPGQAVMAVDLNIYGPKSKLDEVGRELSTNKAFLQDPDKGTDNMEYNNPHIISFTGIAEPDQDSSSARWDLQQVQGRGKPARSSAKEMQQTASNIYHSLTRFRALEKVSTVANVITPLLEHQQTALSFMLEREDGPLSADCSLWDSALDDLGRQILGVFPRAASEQPGGRPAASIHLDAITLTTVKVILNSWLQQIGLHLDDGLQVRKYYGRRRNKHREAYLASHIVLTTYHTVASSFNNPSSAIYQLDWYRVILDEGKLNSIGHVSLKSQATSLYQAASALSARSRWCLTATPLQNRLDDVGSLLAFLRIAPFDNPAVFRKYISNVYPDDREMALDRLVPLLNCVCLRRSQNLLGLSNAISQRIRYVTLSVLERDQYESNLRAMSRRMSQRVSADPSSRDYFGIFQAQLQLRIFCNHGTFQKPFAEDGATSTYGEMQREDMMLSLDPAAELKCLVCGKETSVQTASAPIASRRRDPSGVLCPDCQESSEAADAGPDAQAQVEASPISPRPLGLSYEQANFSPEGFSSKIDYLMRDVVELGTNSKSIVFSCWTLSLDLVALHLAKNNIQFLRIDGRMDNPERQANMELFDSSQEYRILLMSTGVGAFGRGSRIHSGAPVEPCGGETGDW